MDSSSKPDGTFAVNPARIKEGVTGLTRDIMTIQAEGDYQKAKALADRLGIVRPVVQKALDKLTSVPVDIDPRFSTATQLLSQNSRTVEIASSAIAFQPADNSLTPGTHGVAG